MALQTINEALGLNIIKKKEKGTTLKIYFNKKAHRIALRFDPMFKSGLIEFLYDPDEKKLVIIEGRKDSIGVRKISESKTGSFITSYAKLFKIELVPEKGSLECIKDIVGIPKKSSDGIREVKGYIIDLNQNAIADSAADLADDAVNVEPEQITEEIDEQIINQEFVPPASE